MTLPRAAARPDTRATTLAPMSPLGRLGGWSYRHRRAVAAVWLLILVLVSVAGLAGEMGLQERRGLLGLCGGAGVQVVLEP